MSTSELPIRIHDHVEIVLSDGIILSAMIWIPETADSVPVPAILEYLPYRKRDGTADRDALNHRYFAAHGYACVRVDMRGSGDSEGVLLGEYLQQEQDDALEILRWIAAQEWCTGAIGMIGISWGGFNGLQIAARQPPELKAVISLCSTDDRYDNDVHYMGGCQLVDNFLWGATMFSIAPTPPDPALVGDKWRDMWMERLETGTPYMEEWHQHQRRDEFWQHASICEDYGAVQCPVYMVGGWHDAYSNSIFRTLENLKCPKKGLVGPWAHKYPNMGKPGPPIGFLQESLRWWDKWLKGKETGIMEEPMLRCYLNDTVPPQRSYVQRPGHWVAEKSWPSERVTTKTMSLASGQLLDGSWANIEKISFSSPQTVGFASGRWCPYGSSTDLPGDQHDEAVGSQIFDSQPLTQPLDILGPIVVQLRVASDKPNAFVAAVVSEVLPDGSATRLSYGVLNLTHREGHVDLKPLEPGSFYDVTVQLNECGQRIGAGSVIRLALSTSYFPTVWPSPEAPTLTIDCASSQLKLPVRPETPSDNDLQPFEPAVNGPPLETKYLRPAKMNNSLVKDLATDRVTITFDSDEGLAEDLNNGWRWGGTTTTICSVRPDDPLSARAEQNFRQEFGRGELELAIDGWTSMTATEGEWCITTRMEAWENKGRVFEREHVYKIPRDHM
ncbi:hypothetical protein CkaCkLH20_03674 [Colletotrichum karsti]|uniref:Xaa-Pro dipeptidyl-peptidase C-terminal domain-containing protein n=1 Tax=Colletotrichum karsti TaxID=1095194 RepID=A0A9P6LJW2_9PEZI|nr:uncharacterized protein CkaCkLH20_03674 [Colletotrichum karsti]KAF9878774.1 hypothetical protein CkaCkLH20_03674 [Colletotrichum karsti]